MKSLQWRICSTITLIIISIGVEYSMTIAEMVYGNVTELIGSKRSRFPDAMIFLSEVWIESNLWLLMWIPVTIALVFTWFSKLDWIGAIFTTVSTLMIISALFFIPTTGWITSYHAALVLEKDKPGQIENETP